MTMKTRKKRRRQKKERKRFERIATKNGFAYFTGKFLILTFKATYNSKGNMCDLTKENNKKSQ